MTCDDCDGEGMVYGEAGVPLADSEEGDEALTCDRCGGTGRTSRRNAGKGKDGR